ncbi:TPA: hypothetical protein ACULEF_004782, partial [Escherichia coli]
SLSHLKYRYLHRPHKRPNLHPSGPEQPAEQFSSCINAFTERRGDILPGIIAQRMGEKQWANFSD